MKPHNAATTSITCDVRTESAMLLERIAGATERTTSSIISDWIEERLAVLGQSGILPEPEADVAIGEVRERQRNRYRPTDIQVLMVGESPPAGETFFYQADSHLFHATRDAFSRAWGEMPTGSAFLELFREKGFWLYDVSPQPVNRKRGRPRKETVASGVAKLAEVIANAEPDFVIAVKTSLEGPVRQAAALAGFPARHVRVLPFPLYQWREAYIAELAEFLGVPERPRTPPAPSVLPTMTLEDAMVAVLEAGGRGPMPARQVSNEITGRELYAAPDGKRPDYQQILYAAKKARHLFRITRQGVSLRPRIGASTKRTASQEE